MKKSIYYFISIALLCTSLNSVAAHEMSAPYIVRVTDLSEDMFNDFLEQKARNMIVEFPEETYIPFKQILKGNLIQLVPEERSPVYFKVMRTFYVRLGESGYELSTDFQTWKSFLDFATGQVSFHLQTIDGQPTFCSETILQLRD